MASITRWRLLRLCHSVPGIVIPSEARNLHLAMRYTVSVLGLANAPDICYNTRRLASR